MRDGWGMEVPDSVDAWGDSSHEMDDGILEAEIVTRAIPPTRLGAGIHEIPFDVYLADPCEEPSLRSGDIQRLLTQTPRHFIANHPRLSPNPPRINSDRMDLGSIVHKLVLGKGDEVVLCDFGDWKKQKARDERDEARAAGKIPCLPKMMAKATEIALSAVETLKAEFGEWPFGETEKTFIWSEQIMTSEGDEPVTIWCRTRPDVWCSERALVIDVKSTEIILSDDGVQGRLTEEEGRSLTQAALQLRGATALHPELAGRIVHCHAFVETKVPYAAAVNDTPPTELKLFDRRCTRAMERYAGILEHPEHAPQTWPRRHLGARPWLINKLIDEEGDIET